ncbi:hypothetical protein PMAYCL1PPCAC_31997 [Pristionchus mayeri]|uniref:Fibronectin type-III domain-containing protein n=1 Tax=Pristionchus mayeri TaxID=1317129 RepID=A0AAN5DFX9_9BILA|nr:hypothetical protein PMAYCL1PPCAC_31997 [Pristionchus mayeri]
MKSRRSVIRAILFMLRLQKSVTLTRESRRSSSMQQPNEEDKHHRSHATAFSRAESTRHRRRSSQRQNSQHRNSAPGGALPHRSPSLAKLIRSTYHPAPEAPVHFGVFSAMSQPYSVGLSNVRGAPILSVCAGAAHTLASTALLCRQQSLDEYATRVLRMSNIVSTVSVARQTSVESFGRSRKDGTRRHSKREKSNAICMMRALIAIENDDADPLTIAIKKGNLEANSIVTTGAFSNTDTIFSLLDIALLLNSQKCAQVLLNNGARETKPQNSLASRRAAVEQAISQIEGRKVAIKGAVTSTKIEASSARSVLITPEVVPGQSKAIVVKYRVEWSSAKTFDEIAGTRVITEVDRPSFEVSDIDAGEHVYFRVCAGTIHDYGDPVSCTPAVVEMSSWEEVTGERDTREKQLETLHNLTAEVETYRDSVVWQTVFPKLAQQPQKKKKGLMDLFLSSSKFLKSVTNGCHLAALVYCEGKMLCTFDDCLPTFIIDENVSTLNKEDIQWLLKLSLSWDQLSALSDANPSAFANNSALSFRSKVISAAADMMSSLGLKDIGRLAQPITHENAVFLVTVRYVTSAEQIPQAITTQWLSFEKMLRKHHACPAMDRVLRESVPIMNFFESSQIPLQKGLYVAYLKMHSSLNSIRLVVPDNLPSVLPYVSVRQNPHVTKDEWEWIQAIDHNEDLRPTPNQRMFHRQLSKAINSLLHDLDVDPDLVPGHRMFTSDILRLNKNVSIILILPKPEDVCSAPTGSSHASDMFEQRRGCTSISVSVFEMIHLSTYCPTFISAYCKLSIFLEHFIMISQFEQRKCMLEVDSKVVVSKVGPKILRSLHSLACTIPLSRLLAPIVFADSADPGYSSDLSVPDRPDFVPNPLSRFPRPQSLMGSPSLNFSDIDRVVLRRRHRSTERLKARAVHSQPITATPDRGCAVIVVFAAFDCGLENGTRG